MKPWNTGKMPVPHPFARHIVAGEDARAPDSLLPFSPETHDPSHIPITTDYGWIEH